MHFFKMIFIRTVSNNKQRMTINNVCMIEHFYRQFFLRFSLHVNKQNVFINLLCRFYPYSHSWPLSLLCLWFKCNAN